MREVNLCNINHLACSNLLEFFSTKAYIHYAWWIYIFDHPGNSQLPSSPETPGWRRMTSEDVPSALALINRWSSQFEIRQVFNSEEEFAHEFLSPIVPNYLFTYVVENETNNITDLVSFRVVATPHLVGTITTVASTQSPVKQLINDALVCAKKSGVKTLAMYQSDIKSDVLLSLSFQGINGNLIFSIYNYKYHGVPENNISSGVYCK